MAQNINEKQLWKIIRERGWVGFGLLGFAMVAIGATRKIPQLGDVTDRTIQVILIFAGLALIIFACVGYWFPRQHETEPEVSNAGRPRVSTDLARNKRTYGIRVLEPKMPKKTTPIVAPPCK